MTKYRGFKISSVVDYEIRRRENPDADLETCIGHFCQIYSANDDACVNVIDEFTLAVGHEIPDMTYSSLLVGIAKYVDGCYSQLIEAKWDVESCRTYELFGRALCWLAENESGAELYNTFSEVLGMTDDEIREMGYTTLVPYFNRDNYAQTIADYLIEEGTRDTLSGNLHIPFSEINERYAVELPNDKDLLDRIKDCLCGDEAVADIETNEDFDLMFHTVFCPNIEDRFGETEDENISLNM